MVGFAADSEGVGIISKADERLEETRDVTFGMLETITCVTDFVVVV